MAKPPSFTQYRFEYRKADPNEAGAFFFLSQFSDSRMTSGGAFQYDWC
jgi:hypothetical protein